jgi:hypothetical protein
LNRKRKFREKRKEEGKDRRATKGTWKRGKWDEKREER